VSAAQSSQSYPTNMEFSFPGPLAVCVTLLNYLILSIFFQDMVMGDK